MNIVYYSFSRFPFGQIAGYIHLNKLPANRIPSIKEILATVPGEKPRTHQRQGIPYFFGIDDKGHAVYGMDLGINCPLALQVLCHSLHQYDHPLAWKFYNILDTNDYLLQLLSLPYGVVPNIYGRYLLARGVRRIYPRLIGKITDIKEMN